MTAFPLPAREGEFSFACRRRALTWLPPASGPCLNTLLQAFLANHSALFQRPTLPKTAWPLSGPQLQRKSTLAPSCTFKWGEACRVVVLKYPIPPSIGDAAFGLRPARRFPCRSNASDCQSALQFRLMPDTGGDSGNSIPIPGSTATRL
jgi:hypothetical protein